MCFLQHTDADFFVVQYERSGLFIHMHESKVLEVKAGVLPYVHTVYTEQKNWEVRTHAGDDESPIIHTVSQ